MSSFVVQTKLPQWFCQSTSGCGGALPSTRIFDSCDLLEPGPSKERTAIHAPSGEKVKPATQSRSSTARGSNSSNRRWFPCAASLDASAEILACLSLMKVPDDDRVVRARAALIDAQSADGSWGNGEEVSRERVHATLVGVLGVMVFPEAFRPDPDFTAQPD